MPLKLESSAFEAGAEIPMRYTGDGEDVSPPLAWSDLPAGTKSLALIVDDPDAPDPVAMTLIDKRHCEFVIPASHLNSSCNRHTNLAAFDCPLTDQNR